MNTTKNTTVYVSNLSYKRDRNGLKSMLSKFGIIKNIKIIVEPQTNQSRGMAFIEMGSVKEAESAIAGLNQQVYDGRTIKVSWAIPQKETSKPALSEKTERRPKLQKDLTFKDVQLAKKARNDAKRKSNPFTFKVKTK